MKTSADTYSEPPLVGAVRIVPARLLFLLLVSLLIASCATAPGRRQYAGRATVSWYGPGFHGNLTSSGERYDMDAMTCAHKTLPFGTRLRLVNVENKRSVVVVVNDRGPFVDGRDIDVSRAAARQLGIIGAGTGVVDVVALGRDMRYAKYLDGKKPGSVRTGGPYTIQVGAFVERTNAKHVRDGLRLNHRTVYVMEAWVNGTKYYRVRVGKFKEEKQAERYARDLAYEGYDADIVLFEKRM